MPYIAIQSPQRERNSNRLCAGKVRAAVISGRPPTSRALFPVLWPTTGHSFFLSFYVHSIRASTVWLYPGSAAFAYLLQGRRDVHVPTLSPFLPSVYSSSSHVCGAGASPMVTTCARAPRFAPRRTPSARNVVPAAAISSPATPRSRRNWRRRHASPRTHLPLTAMYDQRRRCAGTLLKGEASPTPPEPFPPGFPLSDACTHRHPLALFCACACALLLFCCVNSLAVFRWGRPSRHGHARRVASVARGRASHRVRS